MPETPNPYIAGSPVTGPEMFFGREDVFTFVRQALTGQHRDHVLVLYGQRRTGKTSVLYQMSRNLDDRYVCIFIDLHGLAINGLGVFLWELANHISRVLRRDYQIIIPALSRADFTDDPRNAFENIFLDDLWEAIGDRHILLMLDEAIRLEEQVKAGKLEIEVFDYLRHLMQHHPRLNFLFSLGSGLEEMEKEYAFLFNVALYKKISFLDHKSAVALITKPVEDRCPYQKEAVERILEVTSGHPYFTQLICHSVFNRCWGEGGVTLADVDSVLDEAVERGLAVLKHVWEESTPGEKAVLAAMAAVSMESTAQGEGSREAEQARANSRRMVNSNQITRTWAERGVSMPESEVERAVRKLVSRDVITGAGEYRFTVDLMRMWVEKFRRLEWVKEEIEEAARDWSRRDQERREREAQEQVVQITSPQPVRDTAVQATPEKTVSRNPSSLNAVNIILALAGLLAIIFFASELLSRRTASPESPSGQTEAPVNPPGQAEAPSGNKQVKLGGEAAQVLDLAVLEGYVWAATEGGLVRWSADGTYEVFDGSDLGLDCMNAVMAKPWDRNLWVGCGGVAQVGVNGGELSLVGYYNRDDGLGTGIVRALAIDSIGYVWAGGGPDEGDPPPLSVFNPDFEDEPWRPAEAINNQLTGLFGDSPESINIQSIFIDSNRGMWLGLRDAGIVYVDEETAILYSEDAGVGLPDQEYKRILQILVDENGTVWAAGNSQGLLRLRPGETYWETVEVIPGGVGVYVVAEYDGNLWVGGDEIVATSGDGGETWSLVGEGLGIIDALALDEDGRVWAGAMDKGVSVWDGERWSSFQQ